MDSTTPELPAGYTARPATLDDIEEMTDLLNVASIAKSGAPDFTAEELRNDLSTPGFDLEQDCRLVLSPEGRIVAYQDVFAISSVPVHPFVWGRIHPEHLGRGIGTHLLRWGLVRARHVFARVPEDARVAARTMALHGWEPSRELLTAEGFDVIRHGFRMRIELDGEPVAPVWPDGITVHVYDHPRELEDAYRVVHESFRDHFGHIDEPFEPGLERFTHFFTKDDSFDPALWFVAREGDRMVGVSLCRRTDFEEPTAGHVSNLGVLRSHRRRGLGLALLRHSFEAFRARGRSAVTLGVDADSLTGAVRLYESAGMRVYRRTDTFELRLRPGRDLSTRSVEE